MTLERGHLTEIASGTRTKTKGLRISLFNIIQMYRVHLLRIIQSLSRTRIVRESRHSQEPASFEGLKQITYDGWTWERITVTRHVGTNRLRPYCDSAADLPTDGQGRQRIGDALQWL